MIAAFYGVAFPDEFFALAAHLPLAGQQRHDVDFHAWRLARPPERGGPVPAGGYGYLERDVFRCDPALVPLVRMGGGRTEYHGLVLCYRLSDLPTVYGFDPLDRERPVERLGPSLLAVLHDYYTIVAEVFDADRDGLAVVERLLAPGAPRVVRSELSAPYTAPVSEQTLTALRRNASRRSYRSMARLAWALYSKGRSPREVLAECYGAPFPDEFFALDRDLPIDFHDQPWNLADPPDRGGPLLFEVEPFEPPADPDLLPIVTLPDEDLDPHRHEVAPVIRHNGATLCYRLSGLAVGDTAVFDVAGERLADSMRAAVRHYVADRLTAVNWQMGRPSNRGAGSLDRTDRDCWERMLDRL